MKPTITNFLITGQKQCGKSYLINQIVRDLSLTCSGFQTLPYYIEAEKKGFYLHSLIKVMQYENNLPISVQPTLQSCIGIGQTFNTLGVECLTMSIHSESQCIIMDELGKFEREEYQFHNAVRQVLDSQYLVLAVVKKESIPWLETIKNRQDIILFDLDSISQKQAYEEIIQGIHLLTSLT